MFNWCRLKQKSKKRRGRRKCPNCKITSNKKENNKAWSQGEGCRIVPRKSKENSSAQDRWSSTKEKKILSWCFFHRQERKGASRAHIILRKYSCAWMPSIPSSHFWLCSKKFSCRFLNKRAQCLKRKRFFLLLSLWKCDFPCDRRGATQHPRGGISNTDDWGCVGRPYVLGGYIEACEVKEDEGSNSTQRENEGGDADNEEQDENSPEKHNRHAKHQVLSKSAPKEDHREKIISSMAEDKVQIPHQFQHNKLLHLLRIFKNSQHIMISSKRRDPVLL